VFGGVWWVSRVSGRAQACILMLKMFYNWKKVRNPTEKQNPKIATNLNSVQIQKS
jgi:hypothetical protein